MRVEVPFGRRFRIGIGFDVESEESILRTWGKMSRRISYSTQ